MLDEKETTTTMPKKESTSPPNDDASKNLVIHANEAAYIKDPPLASAPDQLALLTALSETFKAHLDRAVGTMQDHNKRDFENLLSVMHQESVRRTALEHRLHSQLLLQNEHMVAMELKLLRLEAKVERREAAIRQNYYQQLQPRSHHSFTLPTTIQESSMEIPQNSHRTATSSLAIPEESPPNLAVISSGASLASGVTAGSFLNDDGDEAAADDESENGSDTLESDSVNPVGREEEGNNREEDERQASQQSTPTQSSRHRVALGDSLESILLNPMIGETNFNMSVRATRGQDTDGNSSLATSMTNSTVANTVVTSTTRGDGSTINVRRILSDDPSEAEMSTPSRRGRSALTQDIVNNREEPRSRSQSPLTIATHASETLSFASASTVGTSIRSSVAVAPRSVYRRAIAINQGMPGSNFPAESRPLADRVVSFTPDLTDLPEPQYSGEAADSITMPDEELDNFSEVADTFASSARVWREEYEARLDALHKRWSNE